MPGRAAYVDGRGGSEMRLNFSGVDEDEIREGVRRIGEVVHEGVDAVRDAHRRGVPGPAARAAPGRPARRASDAAPGQGPAAAPQAAREHSRCRPQGRALARAPGSLKSGARVQDALERLGHEVIGIDVGSELVAQLQRAAPEMAFVALHGRGGEDGTVQELLEVLGIPYTGSGVSACIRASDKVLAKHAMRDAGLPTPDFYAFSETAFKELGAAAALPAIEARLEFPIVVKPASQGSALGIKFARDPGRRTGRADRRVLL